MNYLFLFYCFLSAVIVSGGGFFFYTSGQQIVAPIFFVGGVIAALFFGFRWFNSSGELGTGGKWPPTPPNYCPDFLTLTTVDGEQVCIDTVGVAQAGGMAKWSDPTQTDEQYLFHLSLNTIGAPRITSLCAEAKAKGVTWEGVWDGSICLGTEPPKPPSS